MCGYGVVISNLSFCAERGMLVLLSCFFTDVQRQDGCVHVTMSPGDVMAWCLVGRVMCARVCHRAKLEKVLPKRTGNEQQNLKLILVRGSNPQL